jgi:hypothetical protein
MRSDLYLQLHNQNGDVLVRADQIAAIEACLKEVSPDATVITLKGIQTGVVVTESVEKIADMMFEAESSARLLEGVQK